MLSIGIIIPQEILGLVVPGFDTPVDLQTAFPLHVSHVLFQRQHPVVVIVHDHRVDIVELQIQSSQTAFDHCGRIPRIVLAAREAFFGKGKENLAGGRIGRAEGRVVRVLVEADHEPRVGVHRQGRLGVLERIVWVVKVCLERSGLQ